METLQASTKVQAKLLKLWFCYIIYREFRDHVKDLSCLSKDLRRTVIVDNNPFSFLLQPLNGIPCIPFSAGQPQDSQVRKFSKLVHLDSITQLLTNLFHVASSPYTASRCHSSTSKAPRTAERRQAGAVRKIPHA